jgi:stage IV sporulation protein FB
MVQPISRYLTIRFRGTPVRFHWTLLLLVALVLLASVQNPLPSIAALTSFVAVLLLHESGHAVLARRSGSTVVSITLYPFVGLCHHEQPVSPLREALIAWGGVLAQLVIAVPTIAANLVFGYTGIPAFDAPIAIFGWWSLLWVLFNLLPVPPLDGSTAWGLVPLLLRRRPRSQHKIVHRKGLRIVK